MRNGRTVNYDTEPTTTITKTADGGLTARTVWSPIAAEKGGLKTGTMGLAAIGASGAYISQMDDPSASNVGPTYYCPDISSFAASISAICASDRNRIVSIASTAPNLEKWLRVDHANMMESAIEFDNGTGIPTPVTGAGLSLDDIDGSSVRQIVNISRLYNVGDSGKDSIILGQMDGNNIYSDSFISSNNLMSDAVIVDGDLALLRDLYIKRDAYLQGDINIDGHALIKGTLTVDDKIYGNNGVEVFGDIEGTNDFIVGNDIEIDRDARVGRDLNVIGDVEVDGNATAENIIANDDVIAHDKVLADGNIESGDDIIASNNIMAGDSVGGLVFYDTTFTGTFTDFGDGGYLINASHNSRINDIDIEGRIDINDSLYLNNTNTEGATCSLNGLLSRDSSGSAMSCINKKWVSLSSSKPSTGSCVWRETGLGKKANGVMHSKSCNAGEYMVGWRGMASDYIDYAIAVQCCPF